MTEPHRITRTMEIKNRLGLHARAAAQLVQAVSGFDAEITVVKDGQAVNAKSILGLMMLAAAKGASIEVTAEGPDAERAIQTVADLVDARFNEED